MSKLAVNSTKNGFELNGKPFFYLADTVWSAFTNATIDEWAYYLKLRKEQGYNVLQINTLPQWDRCLHETGLYPFRFNASGKFDFSMWNQAYYDRAQEMCRMAVDKGFQLALVVLWTNYVPGTWGSEVCGDNVLPYNMVKNYVAKTVEVFDEFHPIYLVSGDTGFDSDESIAHYQLVLDTLNELRPEALKAFHIKRGYDYIPDVFLNGIDFYMYQSGHNRDQQSKAYEIPRTFSIKYPKKPIVNAEPCYEQMGYSRQLYGRFTQEEVRKAAWTSILAGASAGVTYGAHGVWNWEKEGAAINPILGEGFDSSDTWYRAVHYPGAWDYGWIKQFFIDGGITSVDAKQTLLLNDTDEIRVGQTNTGVYLIYLPHTTKVRLQLIPSKDTARVIEFTTGRIAFVDVIQKEGKTFIAQHPFEGDALIVL